ncbi:hypothetical protein ACFQY0_03685 [Haloferula chungangensis]|uniref:Peptidase C39-like domain-containing protein n=1 Tax=Haloferula chungangensis TaxID=1048331 RepID=A0ABW2L3Y5_9BACT
MLRKVFLFLILISVLSADDRWAPNAVAGPVNQLVVSGNACGPAALLTSIRCGDESWQQVSKIIPGSSDRSKLLYIIKAHGMQASQSLKGRKRWTRHGINAEDLEQVAAELAALKGLPSPRSESLFCKKRETPVKLIDRTHDRMRDSLKRGFPPVLSLKRYVFRQGQWQSLQGHFVTVVRVPEKIDRKATSFSFTYFDPWQGKKHEGSFRVPTQPILSADGQSSSCLEVFVPSADIGRKFVKSGEKSFVVPVGVMGRW